MGVLRTSEWQKLPMSLNELCINTTLRCGQTFRWRQSPSSEWSIALHGRILSLRQDASHLHYRTVSPSLPTSNKTPLPSQSLDKDDTVPLLHHYFNLTPHLPSLYAHWSALDPHFRRLAPRFTGVRILQQDAWEALVGFICSSNNHISRISSMVEKLCTHFGTLIGEVDGVKYFDFPEPKALAGEGVEGRLRELGFGYRAGYLWKTAKVVDERGVRWLEGLRNPEAWGSGASTMAEGGREGYRTAHEALLTLAGVGPKVADCVCLMGLGWGEAVPVDTHVWQIAQRDYRFGKRGQKSLTKGTYDAVANMFRGLWGSEAGWAHSVLFTADLKAFAEKGREGVKKVKEEEEVELMRFKEEEGTVMEMKRITKEEETVVAKALRRDSRKRSVVEDEEKVVTVKGEVVRRSKRRKQTG